MIAYLSASELAALVRRGEVSPVEIVDALLARIHDLNPSLNAYLTLAESEARQAARAAELAVAEGCDLPPLHGVPFSIKDVHFTRGTRTTGGSLVYKDFVPDEDSVVVERLRRAGAILIGKTNTPEFALSSTTENRLGDDCRNPWDLERTAGGSSGGAAAAAAAGLGPLAIGSDRGGSIRIPAGYCGVYGFKPTHGRVPLHAAFAGSAFTHIGPITRTVRDAAVALDVMSGFDRRDPTSLRDLPPGYEAHLEDDLGGVRIAWSSRLGGATVDREVRSIAESACLAFEQLGCVLEEASPDIDDIYIAMPIMMSDEFARSGHLLKEHAEELMPEVRLLLENARTIPGYAYSQAMRALERFRMMMAEFFDRYDLLLTPTNPVPAFPLRQRPQAVDGEPVDAIRNLACLTMPFNLTGQPAATIPCGFTSNGLPVGLQVAAAWGRDDRVIAASAAFERLRPWAGLHPAEAQRQRSHPADH